jgi:hypothetical protein
MERKAVAQAGRLTNRYLDLSESFYPADNAVARNHGADARRRTGIDEIARLQFDRPATDRNDIVDRPDQLG